MVVGGPAKADDPPPSDHCNPPTLDNQGRIHISGSCYTNPPWAPESGLELKEAEVWGNLAGTTTHLVIGAVRAYSLGKPAAVAVAGQQIALQITPQKVVQVSLLSETEALCFSTRGGTDVTVLGWNETFHLEEGQGERFPLVHTQGCATAATGARGPPGQLGWVITLIIVGVIALVILRRIRRKE